MKGFVILNYPTVDSNKTAIRSISLSTIKNDGLPFPTYESAKEALINFYKQRGTENNRYIIAELLNIIELDNPKPPLKETKYE